MDEKVVPLVKYFNNCGLKTCMSCQGHNKTNQSMFWISFDPSTTEEDVILFQQLHLDRNGNFTSCGRFAKRLWVGKVAVVKQWHYFAATIEAAEEDLNRWRKFRQGLYNE